MKGGVAITKTIHEPWFKLKSRLNYEDYDAIHTLQLQCCQEDQITLKLELDYKLSDALNSTDPAGIRDIDEFMYFDGKQLIGYLGICGFGDLSGPLEITGMVDPQYRRLRVFTRLHELVLAECKRRNARSLLALCDKNSLAGQEFLKKKGAKYKYSEFEMYLSDESFQRIDQQRLAVNLRKASNADACEIARQNRIYFADRPEKGNEDVANTRILFPEEEERRGMTIYLAEKDDQMIGKVHLQLINGAGGIYGLGVLPECRGRGFGRAILLNAIEKLKNAKATTIMLQVAAENATALNLYKSCGFEEKSVMDYYELS